MERGCASCARQHDCQDDPLMCDVYTPSPKNLRDELIVQTVYDIGPEFIGVSVKEAEGSLVVTVMLGGDKISGKPWGTMEEVIYDSIVKARINKMNKKHKVIPADQQIFVDLKRNVRGQTPDFLEVR